MKKEEILKWQHYFAKNSLKQPFEQIWEPLIKPETIKPNRYEGCMIPRYRLENQYKHGISGIYDGYSDCRVDVHMVKENSGYDDLYEIKLISVKYSRKSNHIIAYLDRVTIYERILKDDFSIGEILDIFTYAQISEFTAFAIENKCTNCIALLMEYKEKNFNEYNPMDEFVL